MRKPFKKNISEIKIEPAHSGSGSRQLLLSENDPISKNLSAMTKAFLAPGAIFDWHMHDQIDEFFLSTQGRGTIEFRDGVKIEYKPNDLIYIPANTEHKIENIDTIINEFYFVRINYEIPDCRITE